MSRVLLPWLNDENRGTGQLARWLQGYDLPSPGGDEEPYVWLLYGLPVGGDRHRYETRLAETAARLVDEKPDVLRPGDMPERLLFNLLFLCSGLCSPEQLAEPLHAMYERRSLEGEWLGVPLYDALLSAVVPNQIDERLRNVWRRMLDGDDPGPFLGTVYDGFEGVLWMPESRRTRGEPHLEALGHALLLVSRYLEDDPHRRSEFTSLLNKVQEVYFGHGTWETDLLNLAHKYEWPKWAVECLPDLSIVVGDVEPQLCGAGRGETEGCKRLLVWWPFAKVLEAGAALSNVWYKTERSLCNGQVFQVILPQSELPFIAGLASFIEPDRLDNPFPSASSVAGNIAGSLSAYESKLGRNDQRVKIIEHAHKDILEDIRKGILI